MSLSLRKYLVDAVAEVFATMIFLDLEPVPPDQDGEEKGIASDLTSMIGLAGDLKGMLSIYCPSGTARGITGAMLGMEIAELDEDVKDAIGEIANMVAGGLKVALDGEGREIELAIPTTAIGRSIRVSGLAGASRIYQIFTTPAGQFALELKYEID